MEYYLSTFEGDGSHANPFKPRGNISGWAMIDLRPDSSVVDGICLLALPMRNDLSGMTYLGNDLLSALPANVFTQFQNRLGLTLTRQGSNVLPNSIYELLVDHSRLDGTRWKPLMPEVGGVGHRRWRIYLGRLIYDAPMVAGGTTITESWPTNQTNNIDGDLDWTLHWGADPHWDVILNRAVHNNQAATDFSGWHAGPVSTQNHYVQAKLMTFTLGNGTNMSAYVVGRANSTTTNKECYRFWAKNSAGTLTYELDWSDSAGNETGLGNNAQDWVSGDVLRVEVNGSSILGKVNGTTLVGPVTDTNVSNAANVFGGIQAFHDGTTSVEEFDDWEMGDIVTATPVLSANAIFTIPRRVGG